MALSALSLAIVNGSIGRQFASTLIGASVGSRFGVLAPANGFYVRNGRLMNDSMPAGTSSPTVRERGTDGSVLDTTLTVSATSADVLDDVQVGTIPANITAAGSTAITGARSGATIAIGKNPDGAWSISGSTLSWSTAAIGKAGRPSIVQAFVKSAPTIALETALPDGSGVVASSGGGGGAGPTLGTVTLSGTLQINVAASGVTIGGATNGSTFAFNIAGISVGTSGTTRTVTGTPATSGALTYTETLAGATGSPKTGSLGTVAGASATAPAAPTLATPTVGNAQVSLSWTDGADGGATITGHKLYRSTTQGFTPGPGNLVGTISGAPPYVDGSLTNGTPYYFRLSAVNSVGEGAASAEQSGTPSAGAVSPTLTAAPVPPTDPRVGIAATGTGATFTGADSVAHEVFTIATDGTATKVADGLSYTPVAADFANSRLLEYRSTAAKASATSTVSRAYAPLTAMFDSMTDADNSAVLSHTGESGNTWAKNSTAAYFGDAIIIGNKMGRGANTNVMIYGFSPPVASYVVEAEITTGSATLTGTNIAFRMSPTAQTFYAFGFTSATNWGMTKRAANTVRTSDLTASAPYDTSPFGGNLFNTTGGTTAPAVKIAANTTYSVAIHVWDEGATVQFAVYVNGCLIIRCQDADATRITAAGGVGLYDAQAAAITSTTGNKVGNLRVHLGRMAAAARADGTNPNTARIDDKPMQAITNAGSLDLRGAAKVYAANDNSTYTRNVGGWCEGGTTDVKVRVEKAVGGDMVLDWVTPTGLTIVGPRWFGTVDLPRSKATTNSAGSAWDVLKYRAYRGSTIVRTGTSGRFGNGIALTAPGSSLASVWGVGAPNTATNEMGTAGLTPNPNSAVLLRYGGTYIFYLTGTDHAQVAGRGTPDFAPFGWKIAYTCGVGANVYMDRMQAEFGGLMFTLAGGVGGTGISGMAGAPSPGWIDGSLQINEWRAQLLAMGGVNIIAEDFGNNEARLQSANSGVLTRADMKSRFDAFHTAVRAISGLSTVPIIVKDPVSDTSTAQTSGANNLGNNRRARQAVADAVAFDSAIYRGVVQFDTTRSDGLHPDTALALGTGLSGARVADLAIAILKNVTPTRITVTSAAKVSDTQTRFTVSGMGADALTTRTGVPGWEIATGSDLDATPLAVSGAVYEGTTGGNATYLVTHASTTGGAYRAGYGEAPGQGTGGLSTADTVSLRDVRAAFPRAVEQTFGGLAIAA